MTSNQGGSGPVTPSTGSNDDATSNRTRQTNRRNNNNQTVLSNSVGYEGECDKIGAILALKVERFHKKVSYEQFIEKISNYIVKKLTDGADIKPLLTEGKDPMKIYESKHMPKALSDEDKSNPVMEVMMQEEVKQFVARKKNIRRNIQSAFGLGWGQCSSALQAYVKGQEGYATASDTYDIKWLLDEVKKASSGIDSKANPYVTMHDAIGLLYRMRQGASETDDSYIKRFKNNVTTIDMVQGGHLFYSPGITGKSLSDANNEEIYAAKEANMAILMLQNADPVRYGELISSLKKGANLGRDEYPTSVAGMYKLMVKYSRDVGCTQNMNRGRRGNAFAQARSIDGGSENPQDAIAGNDGVLHAHILCFNCQQSGHYSSCCPTTDRRRGGATALLHGSCLACKAEDPAVIEGHRLLLDTCSKDNLCNNVKLLHDVRMCDDSERLLIMTNGGSMTYDTVGSMNILPIKSYYNKKSLANIVSMQKLLEVDGIKVTMDSEDGKAINVETIDGELFKFEQGNDGLYSYDMRKKPRNVNNKSNTSSIKLLNYSKVSNLSFLNHVSEDKSNYTKKEILNANKAKELQRSLGYVPNSTLKRYIKNNLIANCDITEEDVDRSSAIYGVAHPILRRKMISPKQVKRESRQLQVPEYVRRSVMLYADIFYVNSNPFLHTKSKDVNYVSIDHLRSRELDDVAEKLTKVYGMYTKRGFTVTDVYRDNEFDHDTYRSLLTPARLHICAKGEHVPIVERSVGTTKEKARVVCQSFIFTRIPRIMLHSLMDQVELWLNAFPPMKNLDGPSPALLLKGDGKPYYRNTRVPFGTYVMAYIGTDNSMDTRAVPAISLKQSNVFGAYYFLNLETMKVIHSRKWAVQPFTDQVVETVHDEADRQHQPTMPNNFPIFESGPGATLNHEDDDKDERGTSMVEEEDPILDVPLVSELESVDEDTLVDEDELASMDERLPTDQLNIIGQDDGDENNECGSVTCFSDKDNTDAKDSGEGDTLHINTSDFEFDINDAYCEDINMSDNESSDRSFEIEHGSTNSDDMEELSNTDDQRPSRPKRSNAGAGVKRLEPSLYGKEYSDSISKQFTSAQLPIVRKLVHVIMTQMSAKKGFKKYGNRAIASMFKELKQLHVGAMEGKPVVEAVNLADTTPQERKEALEAVALMKLKRSGDLKSRVCANGKKQRWFVKGDEVFSSHTAMLESIILTLIMDALEGRDVAVVDIPGAYLHALFPKGKTVLLVLRDELVDIMCMVDSSYEKYVIKNENKRVLYLKVVRALYGCLESALLWYNLYSSTLKDMGFEMNPYENCVANKIINGEQCTIAFYVNDNKISHKDPNVVTSVIDELSKHFGKLQIQRGNKFDILDMDVEIKNRKVYVSMKNHIKSAIDTYEEVFGKQDGMTSSVTPAKNDLFESSIDNEALNERESEGFHTITAKLLHVCKRARPDIDPAVAYLCTRVSCSTVRDKEKIKSTDKILETNVERCMDNRSKRHKDTINVDRRSICRISQYAGTNRRSDVFWNRSHTQKIIKTETKF